MNGETEATKPMGLVYFGKMMAAISHEIKNSLAIINENAGLMEDLCMMAEKGNPLDPERIGTIAGRVVRQIQRADTTVKKMNRLAHSVDDPVRQVDVAAALAFTLELGEKTLSVLGIAVKVAPLETPVVLNTNEFLFMNFLWETVAQVAAGIDRARNRAITISIGRTDRGVELVFSPVDGGDDGKMSWDPVLGAALGASILPLADTRELMVRLPENAEIM